MMTTAGQVLTSLVLGFLVRSVCAGQCNFDTSRFAPGGFNGATRALAVYDDGSGPALYAAGTFTAVGNTTASGLARWDGTAWTPLPGAGSVAFVDTLEVFDDGTGPALYAGGNFTSIGGQPIRYLARWNGTAWSAVGAAYDRPVAALLAFSGPAGPTLFVLSGYGVAPAAPTGRIDAWSSAGWTPLTTMNAAGTALEVFDDGTGPALYASGYWTTIGGTPGYGVARWTGAAWVPLGGFGPPSPWVVDLEVWDDGTGPALYATGPFTPGTGGPPGCNGIARWDGSTWSALGSGLGGTGFTGRALAVFGAGSSTALYVAGEFSQAGGLPARRIASFDGTTWAALDAGLGNDPLLGTAGSDPGVRDLQVFDGGSGPELYVAGGYLQAGPFAARCIARWNGTQWRLAGADASILGYRVEDLEVFDDGTGPALHAAGLFAYAGAIPSPNIARWDGASFGAFPGGLTGVPPAAAGIQVPIGSALEVFDDGGGPALYAGGRFTTAGAVAGCNSIARWDGANWSPLGAGIAGPPFTADVTSLAVWDDGTGPALYAGGFFATAGGIAANNIARWNGVTWSPLGSGVTAGTTRGVVALAVHDDGSGEALYAAGMFTTAGGLPAQHFARWNGSQWQPLPGLDAQEPNASVEAFAVFAPPGAPPRLFLAGSFYSAGGLPSNGLAAWTSGTLAPVLIPGSVGNYVSALHVFDDGAGPSLYASGSGGPLVRGDGTSWTAIGGPTYTVRAMATFRSGSGLGLYLGGTGTTTYASLNVYECPAAGLSLRLLQPGGPGSAVHVIDTNLTPGHAYYNLFSLEPCPGIPGSGPYLGLCATNPAFLIDQLLLPAGIEPFHVIAPGSSAHFGPYAGLPPMTVDAVAFEFQGGALGLVSGVARLVIQ